MVIPNYCESKLERRDYLDLRRLLRNIWLCHFVNSFKTCFYYMISNVDYFIIVIVWISSQRSQSWWNNKRNNLILYNKFQLRYLQTIIQFASKRLTFKSTIKDSQYFNNYQNRNGKPSLQLFPIPPAWVSIILTFSSLLATIKSNNKKKNHKFSQ